MIKETGTISINVMGENFVKIAFSCAIFFMALAPRLSGANAMVRKLLLKKRHCGAKINKVAHVTMAQTKKKWRAPCTVYF